MNQHQNKVVIDNELIDKLYEGTLTYIESAEQGIIENNTTKKNNNITKALDVISELDCALDQQLGGEIATKLSLLYQFSITNLHTARVNNDISELRNVKEIIANIKSAFQLPKEGDQADPVRQAM